MFWGLTPALDLLEQYENDTGKAPDELNILLIGAGDSRHLLQTIARKYRHNPSTTKLKIYIIEASIANVAKQLLLLYVALQPIKHLGLMQKTKIFMELYGNTLLRPYVAKYLTTTATHLIEIITNYDDYLHAIMPYITLDNLKYKERDCLENLFKFWCSNDHFDIIQCWDKRVRRALGPRYDTRMGAFDWDLNMRFHSIGGRQVCAQEYKSFRANGIAFNWLESDVSKPNRTMVSGIQPHGSAGFVHCGYLGDIQTGPFVAYGLTCDDQNYLVKSNNNGVNNAYRATDVTERNLQQIFHELEFGCEYHNSSQKTLSDYQLGSVVMKLSDINKVVDINTEIITNQNKKENKNNKCVDLDNVEIIFLSISTLNLMKYKVEYKNKFNLIYFGGAYLEYLTKEIVDNIAAVNTLILIENQRFVLHFRDKQLQEHCVKIKETVAGLSEVSDEIPFDPLKDDYAKFIVKKILL